MYVSDRANNMETETFDLFEDNDPVLVSKANGGGLVFLAWDTEMTAEQVGAELAKMLVAIRRSGLPGRAAMLVKADLH